MKQLNYRLDEKGEPVPEPYLIRWAKWFNTPYHLAKDEFGDILVSTIFLGIDHNFSDKGPPILWETMIFGGKHDQYQERYSSKEAALEGHRKAVELARGQWWRLWQWLFPAPAPGEGRRR